MKESTLAGILPDPIYWLSLDYDLKENLLGSIHNAQWDKVLKILEFSIRIARDLTKWNAELISIWIDLIKVIIEDLNMNKQPAEDKMKDFLKEYPLCLHLLEEYRQINHQSGQFGLQKPIKDVLIQKKHDIVIRIQNLFRNKNTDISFITSPGRLVALLGEAIESELSKTINNTNVSEEHLRYSLFHGVLPMIPKSTTITDSSNTFLPIKVECYLEKQLPEGSIVEGAFFIPLPCSSSYRENTNISIDWGKYLVLTFSDGFIEMVHPSTGERLLTGPFDFQSNESDLMVMEDPVISLEYIRDTISSKGVEISSAPFDDNHDTWYLVSGSMRGNIAIWSPTEGGSLLRTINGAHHNGVAVLRSINNDEGRSLLLLSGGYDGQVKVWSIPSGKLLGQLSINRGNKDFGGHGNRGKYRPELSAIINDMLVIPIDDDENVDNVDNGNNIFIVACDSNGYLVIWSSSKSALMVPNSAKLVFCGTPLSGNAFIKPPLKCLQYFGNTLEMAANEGSFTTTKTYILIIATQTGKILRAFISKSRGNSEIHVSFEAFAPALLKDTHEIVSLALHPNGYCTLPPRIITDRWLYVGHLNGRISIVKLSTNALGIDIYKQFHINNYSPDGGNYCRSSNTFELVGMVHHPKKSQLITFDTEGMLRFWR